jgi:putative ABC transport system permease protein
VTTIDTHLPTVPTAVVARPSARPASRRSIALGPLSQTTTGSMAIRQSLLSALEAVLTNKLRSILTMLGIIIGVGAVIIVVALGAGATATVQKQLAGLGTNLLTISPGGGGGPGQVRTAGGSAPTLTEPDALAIQKQIPGLAAVSPNLDANGVQVVAGNQNWSTSVQANYPSIFTIQNQTIASGSAFTEADETASASVAVIGQTVATNLFGTANPVGQKIMIRNVPFVVKGVLASKGSNGFRDQDDLILIPYSTAQLRLFHQTNVNDIYVQFSPGQDSAAIQAQITSLLKTRHHLAATAANDFRVFNNAQLVATASQTDATLTYLLAGVAAVSLVVGGIGIMNIMLVSVTERTREIGIRMAIGARTGNILSQFLIEATLLSAAGGLAGIALGVGGSFALGKLASWTMLVTPFPVVASFGFAALIGIFFGFYPAQKASQLNPIEALRSD